MDELAGPRGHDDPSHDDPRAGPGARFALADDLGLDVDRVAVPHRRREAHLAEAEVRDRRAERRFGDVDRTRERLASIDRARMGQERRAEWWSAFVQDFRYALRGLRLKPGFAIAIIVTLGLGIGANAAVFSWIEGTLFRPYPLVAHQEELFALTGTARGESGPTGVSWPDILDLQKGCTLIDSFIVNKIMGTTLSIGDRA